MEFIFIWVGFAVVTALAANARGHSTYAWAIIGLLGGVFALIAVLVIRPGDSAGAEGGLPPSWSPNADANPSGAAVANHRGVLIYQHGEGFWVLGSAFRTLADAERHVDNNRPT